ncbi:nucleotide sugar dehydrogenase [Paenibacillus lautus]|uniref:nucleotide sugar dehydrogenase n=1 Tax=Paenibacillus lautus TaxID=1401 RepID=UPI000BBDD932|nr:nucleotide sugar dehydrogenase [Paenibacillus lautus]PCL92280.1 UDP-N-acetyl-D-glucosamine dehydrogenase [Paenibacillus lautus]
MNRKIAVIGLGYVGLPLALTFSREGYQVSGIDLDLNKIHSIKIGKSYLLDISDDILHSEVISGNLSATNDFSVVADVDAIIICVPTPLNEEHVPDLSFLISAGNMLNEHIQKGQTIILESSTYPGTTKDVLKPLLEKKGLKAGIDFYLGYSPERIDPGNQQFTFQAIPKLISGITEMCAQKVYELYSLVFDQVIKVSSTEAAELTKLLENTYRYVNISFINEFATLCDHLKIDAWEVIDAAGTKPYGFTKFFPSPGAGGHCIPVDPLYLQWKVKEAGLHSSFIESSAVINQKMPAYIVNQVKAQIHSNWKEARILVIGITYKKDVNDIRESAAIEIMRLLTQEGCYLEYHDPLISRMTLDGVTYQSIDLTEGNLANADCVIIATDHSQLPVEFIVKHASLIYDARNITRGLTGRGKIIRLGGGGN